MNRLVYALLLVLILSACSAKNATTLPVVTNTVLPPSPTPIATTEPGECRLTPVLVPTKPAVIPGYTQLDETTNLHMTGFVQELDLESYLLKITGLVEQPLTLSLDDLRCLPKVTQRTTLTCPGNFDDVATWSGTPLKPLLEMAGLKPEAKSVLLHSADGYEAFLLLEDALREDNFLAYEWEGQPLPILHGFPLRAVIPSFPGAKWTKWLIEIIVK